MVGSFPGTTELGKEIIERSCILKVNMIRNGDFPTEKFEKTRGIPKLSQWMGFWHGN